MRSESGGKFVSVLVALGLFVGILILGVLFIRNSGSVQESRLAAGFTSTPETRDKSLVVAVVNEKTITAEEWQTELAVDGAMSVLANQAPPKAEMVLDRLINAQLVLQAAKTQRPDLFFDQVKAEERLNALLANWGKDSNALEHVLQTQKLTRPELVAEIQNLLLIEAYLVWLNQSTDAALWLKNQRQTARVSIYTDLAQAGLAATPNLNAAPLATGTPANIPAASPTPLMEVQNPSLDVGSAEGYYAPDFELLDLSGQPVKLSSFRGQPVVINFWATWCPACQKEFPAVRAAYTRFAPQGVVLLGVNLRESADVVREFARAQNLVYPILLDSDGSVTAQYGVFGIPTTVVVNLEGKISSRLTGPLTEEKFAEMVMPLLAQTNSNGLGAEILPTQSGIPASSISASGKDFSLPRQDGQLLNLNEFVANGKESVVLVFYRGQT